MSSGDESDESQARLSRPVLSRLRRRQTHGTPTITPGRGWSRRPHTRTMSAGIAPLVSGGPGDRRCESLPLDEKPAPRPAVLSVRVVSSSQHWLSSRSHPTYLHLGAAVSPWQWIRQPAQIALVRSPGSIYLGAASAVVTLKRHLSGPAVMLRLGIFDRLEDTQREK